MKQFEVFEDAEHSEYYLALNKKIQESSGFEISEVELTALLNKIRSGNRKTIPALLKASELMIYKVMLMIPESRISINERLVFAKKALEDLAIKELNSTRREHFLRFGAFTVKQTLLKLEMEI